jgi:hypothetical protein
MNPPLVKMTLTVPVSADAGVAMTVEASNPNRATTIDRL